MKAGYRVLVSGPSNVAVDNLVERLAQQGQKVVRIGHPARIAEQVHPYALDVIVVQQRIIVSDIQSKILKTRLNA
jgi:DNA polymerase alpha-associated DNA helicase A